MDAETTNLVDEIIADYIRSEEAAAPLDRDQLIAEHPGIADELREFFADRQRFRRFVPSLAREPPRRPFVPPTVRSFGDYELLGEIARGGMGVVYKARQTSLNRIVAIKMILAGNLATEDELRRFRTEAESAANLQHPNIVSVHELGDCDGHQYFSMDYVTGRTLAEMADAGPLEPRDAARYVLQASGAIEYAHQEGVLHRDIKPSNILIDQDDKVRITDFGLASWIERSSSLTRTGQALGTPGYMPPEQAAGRKALVGPPSDIYALGAVLYTLLTGEPPFHAQTPAQTLQQVLHAEPESPRAVSSSVSKDLETICLKCLEKEPHWRYGTAGLLAADLERFLENKPIAARPLGRAERSWRWCRRNHALAGLGTLAAVLLGVLAATLVITLVLIPDTAPWSALTRGENAPLEIAESVAAVPAVLELQETIETKTRESPALFPVQLATEVASHIERLDRMRQRNADRMSTYRKIAEDDQLFAAVRKQRPDNPDLWIARGQVLALANQWQEASDVYSRVRNRSGLSSEDGFRLACLHLLTERPDAYRSMVLELITEAGEISDPTIAYALARICVLVPDMPASREQVVMWAEHAAHRARSDVLGVAYYRAARYERAIEMLQKAGESNWNPAGRAMNTLVLALAYQQQGKSSEAEAALTKARELMAITRGPPMDWLEFHVFLREAEMLIQPGQKPDESVQATSQ